MSDVCKQRKINKKVRLLNGVGDAVFVCYGGKRSPRLEAKLQKKELSEKGSLYVLKESKRDELEVYWAMESTGEKTLHELKDKYKKYSVCKG